MYVKFDECNVEDAHQASNGVWPVVAEIFGNRRPCISLMHVGIREKRRSWRFPPPARGLAGNPVLSLGPSGLDVCVVIDILVMPDDLNNTRKGGYVP